MRLIALLTVPLITASVLVPSIANAATGSTTTVNHRQTETVQYPDDICGARSNTTTYTRTVEVEHFNERANGTWTYHFTDVVTYLSDFDDPTIADETGRLTEVGTFVLVSGDNFTQTLTFHDHLGKEIRIYERAHLTIVRGLPVIDRFVSGFTGCP